MQLSTQVEDTAQPILDISSLPNNLHTQTSLPPLYSLTTNKAYIAVPYGVLAHIMLTTNFCNLGKLFYLLVYGLELTKLGVGKHKTITLSADQWAKRLGCSRTKIFALQKSLLEQGYFIIESGRNRGQNNHNIRNLITPTLPVSIFEELSKKEDRTGLHLPYNSLIESKISYLNRTKLFIPLNYQLLRIITATKELNSAQKIFWLEFYSRCYKCHKYFDKKQLKDGEFGTNIIDGLNHSFYFVSSYSELAARFGCNNKYLSKILNALERAGFIAKQRVFTMKDKVEQRRKDQSLWLITLLLPDNYAVELQKVKSRNTIKLMEDSLKNASTEPCLVSNTEQERKLIKEVVSNKFSNNIAINENDSNYRGFNANDSGYKRKEEEYIDSVLDELEADNSVLSNAFSNNTIVSTSLSTSFGDNSGSTDFNKDIIASYDHDVAKSVLPYNKDSLFNINNIKSNLDAVHKVIFNDFLKKFDFNKDEIQRKKLKKNKFSICSTLIREKIKNLPKNKVDKARRFAYSLVSKGVATGYAATLDKNELAKQFIYHIATWKPTKLGSITQENEIDTALSVAWKAVIKGTWQIPLEWAKAQILEGEFRAYKQKYQESGAISEDLRALEHDFSRLLGSWCNLTARITEEVHTQVSNESNMILPSIIALQEQKQQQGCHREEEGEYNSQNVSNSYSNSENKNYYPDNLFISDDTLKETDLPTSVSELSNNFALFEMLQEQRYFDLKFSDEGIHFKTNTIDNQKYCAVLQDIKVNDHKDVYMTVKFTKETIYDALNDNPLTLEKVDKPKFLN